MLLIDFTPFQREQAPVQHISHRTTESCPYLKIRVKRNGTGQFVLQTIIAHSFYNYNIFFIISAFHFFHSFFQFSSFLFFSFSEAKNVVWNGTIVRQVMALKCSPPVGWGEAFLSCPLVDESEKKWKRTTR